MCCFNPSFSRNSSRARNASAGQCRARCGFNPSFSRNSSRARPSSLEGGRCYRVSIRLSVGIAHEQYLRLRRTSRVQVSIRLSVGIAHERRMDSIILIILYSFNPSFSRNSSRAAIIHLWLVPTSSFNPSFSRNSSRALASASPVGQEKPVSIRLSVGIAHERGYRPAQRAHHLRFNPSFSRNSSRAGFIRPCALPALLVSIRLSVGIAHEPAAPR